LPTRAACFATADLDGDGDLDLAFALYFDAGPVLLVNDGTGAFADETPRCATWQVSTTRIFAADFDGDGDADLAAGGRDWYGDGQVLFNRLRSLEIPAVPMLGGSLTLEVHASSGTPGPTQAAVPVLAAATTCLPLPPLGTLRLDPALSIVLPGVPFVAANGPLVVTIPVPVNVALLGKPIFARALVADSASPSSLALTGLVTATFWR
jgi:hypothetical protein